MKPPADRIAKRVDNARATPAADRIARRALVPADRTAQRGPAMKA
jgi:hypothetical protein